MASIERVPLFPLGIVLYPGERLPLHIFEPRYREMTARCLRDDTPFGVVFFDDGKMASIGCTARIARVLERYEDGRLDILVDGEQRFHLLETYERDVYLTADIEPIEEPDVPLQRDRMERMITQHMRLLELAGRTVRPSLYENETMLSYRIAPNAGLTPQQKQEVLELPAENQRIAYLIAHLEAVIPRVEAEEAFRRKVVSNGHFKDFPPEQA